MKVTDKTMQLLITQRLEDMADRCARLANEGRHDLAQLVNDEALALAQAYDDGDTILVAEALF